MSYQCMLELSSQDTVMSPDAVLERKNVPLGLKEKSMKNFLCRIGVGLCFLLMSVCQVSPSLVSSSTEGVRDILLLDEHPELLTPPSSSLQQRAAMPTADAAGYKVRIVYLVPSNRMPQPDAEKILQKYVETIRGWFGDQMERLGYAP